MNFLPAFQTLQFANKSDFGWYNQITVPARAIQNVEGDSSGNIYFTTNAITPGSPPTFGTLSYAGRLNSDGAVSWLRSFDSSSSGDGFTKLLYGGGSNIACPFIVNPGNFGALLIATGGTVGLQRAGNQTFLEAVDSSDNMLFFQPSSFVFSKFNSSFTSQWARKFTVTGASFTNISLFSFSGSDLFAAGAVDISSTLYGRLAKIAHASPSLTWTRQITDSSSFTNISGRVKTDSSGNVYVFANGSSGSRLLKIDSTGTLVHQSPLGTAVSFAPDSDGNLYVSTLGFTGGGEPQQTVTKYGPTGTPLWSRLIQVVDYSTYVDYLSSDAQLTASATSYTMAWGPYIINLPANGRLTGLHGNLLYTELPTASAQSSIFSVSTVSDTSLTTDTAPTFSTTSYTTASATPTSTRIRF